jgi:hypothetical protein
MSRASSALAEEAAHKTDGQRFEKRVLGSRVLMLLATFFGGADFPPTGKIGGTENPLGQAL